MCFIYFSCILSFFSYETFTNLKQGPTGECYKEKIGESFDPGGIGLAWVLGIFNSGVVAAAGFFYA